MMKTLAIIAEYNPFHNGHLYQLEKAKEITNSTYALTIMSGNFLQRGDAAMWDKYTRAKMAVSQGMDLVLELPFAYSTGSAHDFATGAINILNSLNSIDFLCFGAEDSDFDLLSSVADIVLYEPEIYKYRLKEYIESGYSYPVSRSKALSDYMKDSSVDSIVKKPNNILAIEYLCALKKTNSKIVPILIKRSNSNYHDTTLNGCISSATAIRASIGKDIKSVINNVPEKVFEIIQNCFNITSPIDSSLLTPFLQCKLLENNDYTNICDINESISNKLKQMSLNISFNEATLQLGTKEITNSRVSRALIHLITEYTEADRKLFKDNNYALYANILGFRKSSSPLIRHISENSLIPLITKKADYTPNSMAGQRLWELDTNATKLYNCLIYNRYKKDMPNDFTTKLSIL